jgi:hypothetical protein
MINHLNFIIMFFVCVLIWAVVTVFKGLTDGRAD